jgi:surfeit locus 1 family protein
VKRPTPRDLLPPLAGIALVVLFTTLGFWQLDRAEQKRAVERAFAGGGEYLPVSRDAEYDLYQPLVAVGRYLHERQFLIDNMILDGRIGYFVVTPFEYAADAPLLLVNRGWVPKLAAADKPPAIPPAADAETEAATVKGRTGRLPRVGIRAGEAFSNDSWPRTANWPTIDELSAALGRDVLPFVLLADPEPGSGLIRRWEPQQPGPMRHIGYAFQWFALSFAVVVVAIVVHRHNRKKQAER